MLTSRNQTTKIRSQTEHTPAPNTAEPSNLNNSTPKIYKRDGYEFQVVEQSGDVSRAIGRKGKAELHDVIALTGDKLETRWSFATEYQAREKFKGCSQESDSQR